MGSLAGVTRLRTSSFGPFFSRIPFRLIRKQAADEGYVRTTKPTPPQLDRKTGDGGVVERASSVVFEQTPRCPVEVVRCIAVLSTADRRPRTARIVSMSAADR